MTGRDEHTGVAVLDAAVHLPGWSADDLPGLPAHPAEPPQEARKVLGRKGLLGKEPATLLALCAVHRMFGLPPVRPAEPVAQAEGTAVLVACNLGNVQTVCGIVDDVREGGVKAVSPLDAPNASSNVIASTVAIWYGLTGPNLAVCSGATAGLDAVRLATLLLRSGRARRALVVGVEPEDPVATGLAGGRLRAGAACVLLGGRDSPAPWLGPVRDTDAPAGESDGLDVLYGASGVVRLALAAGRLPAADTQQTLTVHCGSEADGYLAAEVGRV
ncbi:beta-ketoacyl synthase N-terminal-like domain-containing protein [Amycolatopsis aidingensis]|uniref:beta-ketoacyl synthase N-terminal-like domain-containing protein n=1 Tax=Amycolatopsis aidingensis TaxID=2842453 RepID=UPI001C0D990B|nr:beta-ketoacyl synthase N-terminal-like domain-containing protein [Amycolatopsis aidingensis]